MQDKLRQFVEQRILSPQGQMFPMAEQMLPTQGQGAIDMATQVAMGMTSSPVPRGDVAFARKLANQYESLKEISLDDFNTLLRVARQNLDIPDKTFKKMKINEILAELLGLAEKPR